MLDSTVLGLLAKQGIAVDGDALQRLERYVALVREYNERASLVSLGDAAKLESVHLPDSLSLASFVRGEVSGGGSWIDVGSGGGFPAIPIKAILPDLPLVMVERSVKKAGVLRGMLEALGLRAEVVSVQFPQEMHHPAGRVVITARAVERAVELHRRMGKWTRKGDVFLCQSVDAKAFAPAVFHVEHVEDGWSGAGLRRGNLWRVSRR